MHSSKHFYDDTNYSTSMLRYFMNCNLTQQYVSEFLLESIPIPTFDRCTMPSYKMQYTPRAPVPGPKFTPSTVEYQSATLFSDEEREKWFPHAVHKDSRLRIVWTPEQMVAADNKTPVSPPKSPRKLRTWGSEDDDDLYIPKATPSTTDLATTAYPSTGSSSTASSSTASSSRDSEGDIVMASTEQHVAVGESSDMEGSDCGSDDGSDTDDSDTKAVNGSVSDSDSDDDDDVGFAGALRRIRRSESVEPEFDRVGEWRLGEQKLIR